MLKNQYSVELVNTSEIFPAVYNPRKADEQRLKILELSLKKLGFILPTYAEPGGEILSGHQRHHVATERLGWDHIPRVVTNQMTEEHRKAINIAFNRGTNDFTKGVSYEELKEKVNQAKFDELCSSIPDKKGEDRFPCVSPEWVDVELLKKANEGQWSNYSFKSSKPISKYLMNIVCTPDNVCVNGIGRLQNYMSQGLDKIPVVYITEKEKEFADIVLNFLTMDFDMQTKYGDTLRYNSFRRKNGRIKGMLSTSFCFPIRSQGKGRYDIRKDNNGMLWRNIFGTYVLDFGAGTLADTNILREQGVNCIPFEPYQLYPDKQEIDYERSVHGVIQFLKEIEEGKQFSSIFINAVLNSVPFHNDRVLIVKLLSLLAQPDTYVYGQSASATRHTLSGIRENRNGNHMERSASHFELTYEPNITLAGIKDKPKMQKHFELNEWMELWQVGFNRVKCSMDSQRVYVVCSDPKKITSAEIRAIAELEFNLPYPGDKRMGLVEEAYKALKKRQKLMA
jgi:hypothetical protein